MPGTAPHLDRHGLEVLGVDECLALLDSQSIGRVAFVHAGSPHVVPVTYLVGHGGVAFRTGEGSKLDAAIMGRAVAFEVDGIDLDRRAGWSVLLTGTAELVDDADRVAELEEHGLRPWSPHAADGDWVLVRADSLSGRRIPAQ